MSNQQDPVAAYAPSPRASCDRSKSWRKRFSFEPARVEVTEGERVRLVVTSGDGVHGIEIKKFKVNKKVPARRRGHDRIRRLGGREFPILCSEYCGDGHEDMKGMLVVAAKSAR